MKGEQPLQCPRLQPWFSSLVTVVFRRLYTTFWKRPLFCYTRNNTSYALNNVFSSPSHELLRIFHHYNKILSPLLKTWQSRWIW